MFSFYCETKLCLFEVSFFKIRCKYSWDSSRKKWSGGLHNLCFRLKMFVAQLFVKKKKGRRTMHHWKVKYFIICHAARCLWSCFYILCSLWSFLSVWLLLFSSHCSIHSNFKKFWPPFSIQYFRDLLIIISQEILFTLLLIFSLSLTSFVLHLFW